VVLREGKDLRCETVLKSRAGVSGSCGEGWRVVAYLALQVDISPGEAQAAHHLDMALLGSRVERGEQLLKYCSVMYALCVMWWVLSPLPAHCRNHNSHHECNTTLDPGKRDTCTALGSGQGSMWDRNI